MPVFRGEFTLMIVAFILFLIPRFRNDFKLLTIPCTMAFAGIWIEKGMGLVIPGFIPSPLGEIVEYTPNLNETLVCFGIWAFGFFILTILLKGAIGILLGDIKYGGAKAVETTFKNATVAVIQDSDFDESADSWTTVAVFLPNGRVPKAGEKFVQSDLAKTLQFMADQDRAEAVDAFRTAVSHDPTYAKAWHGLATALHRAGRIGDAIQHQQHRWHGETVQEVVQAFARQVAGGQLQPLQSGKVNLYGTLLFGAAAVRALVLILVNS